MATVNELHLELDDITTMKLIASAFTEAAAARIQKIKDAFETNQEFYADISNLYHLVQMSAKKQDEKRTDKAPQKTKKVSVAVTSNQRFYGNLNINIMMEFLDATKHEETDLIVIGNTGRDYIKSVPGAKPHTYFPFAKESPIDEETKRFLETVRPYGQIVLYFPKFVSLVTQKVGVLDIAQIGSASEVADEDLNILFEPDLSNILGFFEQYVRSLLFHRVMMEADLSRTAARLITMSGAEERSTDMIKQKKSQLRKLQSSITNAKLLETFAAISGWEK